MKEYVITSADKGQHDDITLKLQQVLAECRFVDEDKIIRFEKDTYHFYWDSAEERKVYASNTDTAESPDIRSAINIEGIRNLTIDGGGSEFIMHGRMIAVRCFEGENINLRNFSWDFPAAGTFEMHIKSVGKYHVDYYIPKNLQWKIDKGNIRWFEKSVFTSEEYWHVYGHSNSHCVVGFNRKNGNVSRYPISKSPLVYRLRLKRTGENTLRVYYLKRVDTSLFNEDMSFELCPNFKRLCTGGFLNESKNISLENINICYMHGFAFLTQMCENVSFRNCNFTPDENSDRVCTSYADHLHFSGVKGKVHIENCAFANAHDDPINIHGTFTRVKKAIDSKTLILEYVHNQQQVFQQYHEGDKVLFFKRTNLEAYGDEREFTVESVVNPLCEGLGKQEMKVTFSEELPDILREPKAYAVENVTYTPEVYIGSCKFYSIPTRGILCTTRKKVLIENNIFDGLTMASIYLSNDCNNWYESGAIKDMIIRGNTFYIKKTPHKGIKSAVYIDPIVTEPEAVSKAVHSSIVIENNTIELQHDSAVNGKFTDGIIIRNNKIIRSESYCGEVFKLSNCTGVVVENNDIK